MFGRTGTCWRCAPQKKSLASWPSAGALWLFVPNTDSWLPAVRSQAVSELNWAAALWSSVAGHRACLTCCPCLCLFKSMSLPLSLSSHLLMYHKLLVFQVVDTVGPIDFVDLLDVSWCFWCVLFWKSSCDPWSLLMFQFCWYCCFAFFLDSVALSWCCLRFGVS